MRDSLALMVLFSTCGHHRIYGSVTSVGSEFDRLPNKRSKLISLSTAAVQQSTELGSGSKNSQLRRSGNALERCCLGAKLRRSAAA